MGIWALHPRDILHTVLHDANRIANALGAFAEVDQKQQGDVEVSGLWVSLSLSQ